MTSSTELTPVGLPKGARPILHFNSSSVPSCPGKTKDGHLCGRGWALPFYAAGESTRSYKCGGDSSHPGCGHVWKAK